MDGWTPMHAASHWAQREACELLVENGADMEVKNCVGQTAFDVADPDILRFVAIYFLRMFVSWKENEGTGFFVLSQ